MLALLYVHSKLLIYYIKVFSVLNTTKAATGTVSSELGKFQEVVYGEYAYSHFASYVVVDEVKGRDCCICWYFHVQIGRQLLVLTF